MFTTQLDATIKLLGQEYIDAIVNRNSSQWNSKCIESINDILALDWQEITPPSELSINGCSYFQATKKGVGFQQVADLREYNFPVDFNDGEHGIELIGAKKIHKEKTNVAHLILGEKDGEEIIFTAYPGLIFASIKKFPGLSISELRNLNIPFAVKNCPEKWVTFQATRQGVDFSDALVFYGESFVETLNELDILFNLRCSLGCLVNDNEHFLTLPVEAQALIKGEIAQRVKEISKDNTLTTNIIFVREKGLLYDITENIISDIFKVPVKHFFLDSSFELRKDNLKREASSYTESRFGRDW